MFGEQPTVRSSHPGNGRDIHAASENPQVCLGWLHLTHTGRQMYDLYLYGIEGEQRIDEGEMFSTASSADCGGYSNRGFTQESMRRVDVN